MDKIAFCKFLVIDNHDLLEINNLMRKVNQAVKHPEPVLKMDAPWNRDNDEFNFCNVIYDEDEKLFKMWYNVIENNPAVNAGVIVSLPIKTAYATSTDGIHWDRPKLGLVEDNGSKANNYIFPAMGFYGFTVIKDPSDPPARRYKMIFGIIGRETEWANFHIPLSLAYSADGIVWERPNHVNPVLRGISDGCLSLFYDPDRRKYVLLTRRVPNLPRDISQYESYDMVNWEDKGRVIVPGDRYDPPEMYNFYYMAPFRYEGFYLGMLPAMYTLPAAEQYETFHKSPDYPNDKLGHLEIQLAFSRDAQRWNRPLDRTPVIAYGKPGDPDSGAVYPAENPIVRNGETWIYYTATKNLHCWWHMWEQDRQGVPQRDRTCCMLAKMPEDHWVSLDAGPEGGSFTAKPWVPPKDVYINTDIEKGGSIEVELLTPYGQPMPGYGRSECIPVTVGGKRQAVRWKSSRAPYDFRDEYQGGVCAKFHLRKAKLYSYTFYTLPDPDGQHELGALNFRWTELIKHRSDNWGRNSNEPAGGLPPYRARGLGEE